MKLIRKQKQKTAFNRLAIAIAVLCAGGELAAADAKEKNKAVALEEVVVTAQKREQSLQDTPIAISVLNAEQLEQQGVSSLGDLSDGLVPSLRIHPFAGMTSTIIMAIRGNGPGDIAQSTRDSSVAVYMDDFYLGRAQGLEMELVDLERIEVLHGPQGTLFGRNATGGAISLVSNHPTGEFGLKQTLQVGNYNHRGSITHINLPEWEGLRAKIDYLFSERDGWVDNVSAIEPDFNEQQKRSGRITVDWKINDAWGLNYFYADSHTDLMQHYFQLHRDDLGVIGAEPQRETSSRYAIAPLTPNISNQQQHGLTFNWTLSDQLAMKSLTSYRQLSDRSSNNFGGVLYYNGFIEAIDIEQEQFSQEFRLLGSSERLEWVTGLYYYKENVDEGIRNLFSFDIFGDPELTGIPFTLIDPPVEASPERKLTSNLESSALYGQVTWTPPILDDNFRMTVGLRYSHEQRLGRRLTGGVRSFDLVSNHTDPMLNLEYRINDAVLTYAKWSTAYRSGGVHSRSSDLTPFDREEVSTYELGIKSEWWGQRIHLNVAAFTTNYDNMFIDVQDPANIEFTETINAANKVDVDGGELDVAIKATSKLTLRLGYTYLSGELPLQPNPYNNNTLERFYLTQTPRHAGTLTLDYNFPSLPIGKLSGHLGITSSSPYHHWPSGGPGRLDAYTLVNARLTLSNIVLDSDHGALKASLWAKNLTNEEYSIFSFDLGIAVMSLYNDPRTVGIEVAYEY